MVFKSRLLEISSNESFWIRLAIIVVLLFTLLDTGYDINTSSSISHLVTDGILAIFILFSLVVLMLKTMKKTKYTETLSNENQKSQLFIMKSEKKIQRLSEEQKRLKLGISDYIDNQFKSWGFSIAEKEIALLLLKGFSHNEIADLRGTSERTVRQQSLKIYEKSNLKGRVDLAAFFLEDMFDASFQEKALLEQDR